MTTYYIFTNGLHTTVVDEDAITVGQCGFDDSEEGLKNGALEAAKVRFAERNIDSSGLVLKAVVDTDDAGEASRKWRSDKLEMGLTDAVFVNASLALLEDDDVSVDDDAEVAGYSVQTWTWMNPERLLEGMSMMAPVSCLRTTPPRLKAVEDKLAVLSATVEALLADLDGCIFSDAAECQTQVAAVASHVACLKQILQKPKAEYPLVSTVVRTWEAGEGSAESYSEDQRKPWRLEVKLNGDQLGINMWPAAVTEGEAVEGLNMIVEVNSGRPCVHIGPGIHGDNACHVHVLSPTEVEVAPADRLSLGHSQVYAGEFGPGPGQPQSAFCTNG